jgi:hypothetical protein
VYRGSIASIVGAIALVLIASGCGGSDSETTSTRLTKAEFIQKGDTICQEADGRRLAALAPYITKAKEGKGLPPKATQEELVVTLVLPPFKQEAEELDQLEAPKGDEQEVQALIAAIEAGIRKGEADPSGFLAKGGSSKFGEAEELGRKYGFQHCGRS